MMATSGNTISNVNTNRGGKSTTKVSDNSGSNEIRKKQKSHYKEDKPPNSGKLSCDYVGNSSTMSPKYNSMLYHEANMSNAASSTITYDQFERLLDRKLSCLRSSITEEVAAAFKSVLNTAINDLKRDFTQTTDFLCAQQTDIKSDLQKANDRIDKLEEELALYQSNANRMASKVATLEKISRDRNIEIQEVPESKGENLMNMLKQLCSTLEVSIQDSELRTVRRVAKINPSTARLRNIVVTLSTPRLRDTILSAAYRFNKANKDDKLNTHHVAISGERRRIYVTEHLSSECKQLHAAARKAARDNGFTYVWVRYGKVYMRKNDNSAAILVKDFDVLNRLLQ